MIYIKTLDVSAPLRYLWLKHVTGVDLNVHCARCLVGKYMDNISPHNPHTTDIQLNNGIYYLCGVSLPYVWEKNFHIAFEYSEGSRIEYANNGISVVIENAIELPISESYIDQNNPNAWRKEFRTCRNWQFAHYLKQRKEALG